MRSVSPGISRAAFLAAVALIFGCAPSAKMLVSPGGDVRACPARSGTVCIEGAKSAGYVEQGQVGGIGVKVADMPEPGKGLRILKVVAGSPAAEAGIEPGDFLVRIKGEAMRGKREARMLMFGRQGTKVVVTVRKGGRLVTMTLVRSALEKMQKVGE